MTLMKTLHGFTGLLARGTVWHHIYFSFYCIIMIIILIIIIVIIIMYCIYFSNLPTDLRIACILDVLERSHRSV